MKPHIEEGSKRSQWLWFAGLWLGGLLTAFAAASVIKLALWLMR